MIERPYAAALRRGGTSTLQWLVIEYGAVLHRRRSRQGFPEPAGGRKRLCSYADDVKPTPHQLDPLEPIGASPNEIVDAAGITITPR
jgi:hypothetical protein